MAVDLTRMNPHQQYLVEEFAEEYQARHMSRRDMLRRVLLITGSIPFTASTLLALGCGTNKSKAPATNTAAASPPRPSATNTAVATASGSPAAVTTPGVRADDPAIEAQGVSFPGPAGPLIAYMAKPKGNGPWPGVLVIHENRGLLEQIKDVARRYAKEGFVALAIDLVSRNGGTGADGAANTGFLGRANPDDLVADLLAAVGYLKAQPSTQGKAIGVTGFCFGGGYTFEVAAASKDVKAAVPYYGTATRVLDALTHTTAAVLAIYGEADTRVTAQAPQVEEKVKASGRPVQIKIYPGAQHAFFNDTGGSYKPDAAADAWVLTVDWFRRYLA
jgi:carboxymethylenebutenolidase